MARAWIHSTGINKYRLLIQAINLIDTAGENGLTLIQLRYFLAVVRAGSLSGAARQVSVAQPALSHQIVQLEAELGRDLFHRHARGMNLTAAGARLRDRAVEIIRQVDGTKDELTSTNASPVGTVKLGMATAVNMALSVPLFRASLARYPHVRLHLVESMSGYLLEWAERGQIDLAIAYDIAASSRLHVETLGREELLLVAPPSMIRDLAPRIGIADLRKRALILPGFPHSLRHLVDRVASEAAVQLDIVAEVDSTYSIKKLVAEGLGCAILSRHAVQPEVDAGELLAIPIDGVALHRQVQLGLNLNRMNDPAVRSVSRLIITCFNEHWQTGSA